MSPRALRAGVAWTGLGSAAGLAFLFLETVVATRLLPPAQFGGYVLLLAAVGFLLMATDFGAKTTVTQLIAAGEDDPAAIVATALLFRLAVLAAISALVLTASGLLTLLDPSGEVLPYVAYVPAMLAAASVDELASGLLQGFQRYRPLALAQIARGLVRLGLTGGLLLGFDLGMRALVYAWTVSFALSALYQLWALPVERRARWRPALLARMLRFGAPLQLTRLLWFAAGRIHIVLLAALAGPASVAYYAVAARIPDALQNLADSYVRVYLPGATALVAGGRRGEAIALMNRSVALTSFGAGGLALATALFHRELVGLIFSEQYLSSAPAFALLMLALHLTLVVNLLGNTLLADGRPAWVLAVDALRAGASALGDLALIPLLGVTGAAGAAALAAYAGAPLAVWALRRRGVPPAVAAPLRQTALVLAAAAAGWWLDPAVPYRLLLLGLYVAASAPALVSSERATAGRGEAAAAAGA